MDTALDEKCVFDTVTETLNQNTMHLILIPPVFQHLVMLQLVASKIPAATVFVLAKPEIEAIMNAMHVKGMHMQPFLIQPIVLSELTSRDDAAVLSSDKKRFSQFSACSRKKAMYRFKRYKICTGYARRPIIQSRTTI